MITFHEYKTSSKSFGSTIENMDDWLVLDIGRNRESDCLQESNWHVALKKLGGENYDDVDDTGDVRIVRFGHWACGWIEHIFVRPNTLAHKIAKKLESEIEDYPVLDENDLSEREDEAADHIWRDCYSNSERIQYIRDHRNQFDFPSFEYMLSCVRGKCFFGYSSELI